MAILRGTRSSDPVRRPSRTVSSGATTSFLSNQRKAPTHQLNVSSAAGADLRAALAPRPTTTTRQFAGTPAPVARPAQAAAAAAASAPAAPAASAQPSLQEILDDIPDTATVPETGIEGIENTSTLRDLSDQELATLLDGIAARYGLTREQLLSQENQLGIAARGIIQQARRSQKAAVQRQQRASSERGILRSGLHAKEVGRIGQATAASLSAADQQRQAVQNQIDAQRAALQGQLMSEQALAQQNVEAGLLQFEEGQTVADLLAQLPAIPGVSPGPLQAPAPATAQPIIAPAPGLAQLLGGVSPTQSGAGGTFAQPIPTTDPLVLGDVFGTSAGAVDPSAGGVTSLTQEQLQRILSGLITGL